MKAFEKWALSVMLDVPEDKFDNENYDGAISGWKGALEEVLNHLDHSEEHTQIADWIHDELES